MTATSSPRVLDLFAGPGGWSEGLRPFGLRDVGIEIDPVACATRAAAGHLTIRADVAAYPTAPLRGKADGLIGSAPCQPFSNAGRRAGHSDMDLCHQGLDDLARGRDTRAILRTACADPRSVLVVEPLRYALDLRPGWIALEQVPAAAPLFAHIAGVLRSVGYSAWTGVLNAADYGVPQSRRRAFLLASRSVQVAPPEPTHAKDPGPDTLFGPARKPWVTMADALGWGYTRRPAPTVTGGGTRSGGAEPFGNTSRKAMRAAMDNPDHWAWKRPAYTVSGTIGHVGGKQAAASHLNLEPEEGARLQSFRDGYPFQGSKGQRSLQIGNAVPPLLATAVLAPVLQAAPEVAA
ncbi:DNA cytosine methyltransferase [Streptomyces echinoruber]|uniref:DNA (cytosine-5-)-methyltransferase n=1 Tax=Streptomyces echinoruber TaxID=68898 RepID=A0A918RZD0_9ACTN|nr:DNA cytosine methyltransferase [Streptomyces echinoruber]GHA14624.1 DNA methylase [Streptomyces echinoruber]